MIGKRDLVKGFWELGVRRGMALEVHGALSRFGCVDGGAEAVIEALMEAVGEEGAIVMPSFRLSKPLALTDEDREMGLTTKIRIVDEAEARTGMGILSDTFRMRHDVVSGEGIFRVSAWGKDREIHAAGFGHLIAGDGCALLLGVDIYKLSAMHYVEDVLPEAIRARFAPSQMARARYPEDCWWIEGWEPETKPWHTIEREARARGMIAEAQIGEAACLFFRVRPVIELYREALVERAFSLYGL